jgi:hypothetical protein
MTTEYLSADNFSVSASVDALATELKALLDSDYTGDMYGLLAGYQRVLADHGQRRHWAAVYDRLDTLFKCGKYAVVDGPMIGIPMAIRDSTYFRETVRHFGKQRSTIASIEWMAAAWNLAFTDCGLWMGKAFEPVSREVVADKTANDAATLACYEPATFRIGRNYFREPPRPDCIQGLGLPALTTMWDLKPRPTTIAEQQFDGQLVADNLAREQYIPYSMTGSIFLAAPGQSVVPAMHGKQIYQLNYRWSNLEPVYPMTRLIDEVVQIADGIYLGQMVFAAKHYSLGRLRLLSNPDLPTIPLGEAYGGHDNPFDYLFTLFAGEQIVDYGYQNNGYFLMIDPAYAREVYADTAFPQLRPQAGESGYRELGYDRRAPARKTARPADTGAPWANITDWANDWRHNETLHQKFTTFIVEQSPRQSDSDDVHEMRRQGESILQMLQRISLEISARSAQDDHHRHFEKLHRLFRCGVAPRVVNGLFQGHGKKGFNCRIEGREKRDWYGQESVAHGFDSYHGAPLNLHLGFRDTLRLEIDKHLGDCQLFPGTLASLLADDVLHDPHILDMVWHSIGKYIFPWTGKSFEKISGRKLSMLLDESSDLARRYTDRVRELKVHLASAPHYSLVKKAARHYWKHPGVYARYLQHGPWDKGMSEQDKAFWRQEAAKHWVDGSSIQDERITAADPLMRMIDMNYRVADPSLQSVSQAGPSPFARQGCIFLGVADRESVLPGNNDLVSKKKVFQLHYRYPMIGGPAPIGLCLDELVEIADGLFLGQLIYATALDVPFHSSVDPAEYRYQLFGYFLLLDDAWEHHRKAIHVDVRQG